MKIIVPGRSISSPLLWARIALLSAAVALLGYCAFVLVDTWLYQRQASRAIDRLAMWPAPLPGPGAGAIGGLLGRMEIPRLGLAVVVAEGTDERTLRRAAGHIKGTELPGKPGNVGIAGHRDTLFRPLKGIQHDDVIVLITLQGEYRYRVISTKVVSPYDVEVLKSDGSQILTLVTCYPFYFVGPSPDRFVVRAERVA